MYIMHNLSCLSASGAAGRGGGAMEAMRRGGNKVRLSNLFGRHSLLWESAQPPPSAAMTLISHSARSKISQRASAEGSVV